MSEEKKKGGFFELTWHPPGCEHTRPKDEGPNGPSKVATEAYRDGWDSIFGKRQPAGQA